MKCEVCLKLLEEYVDNELVEHEALQVRTHLATCIGCALEFEGLTAEQEVYSRYDRALQIPPSMWSAIAARSVAAGSVISSAPRYRWRDRVDGFFAPSLSNWSVAGVAAVLMLTALIGVTYLRTRRQTGMPDVAVKVNRAEPVGASARYQPVLAPAGRNDVQLVPGANQLTKKTRLKAAPKANLDLPTHSGANQADVLFSDVAFSVAEDEETEKHIEQAQNLLRSVRNMEFSDDDTEVDVSYEKVLSRRLLNENVVLRRDAEMSGKYPVKILLSSLEPFLLDIANLPEQASPDDLRVIKDRVQKTEIVAALHSY